MKRKVAVILMLIVCLLVSTKSFTVNAINSHDEFNKLSCGSYLLMDSDSKTVLSSFNEHARMPVASICKLMVTLITLERIESGELSMDDEMRASEHACDAEGSQAFLDAGSKYKVSNLLKSVIVASANDSSIVLAEGIAGSEKAFVNLMNERAKELGMKNTVYENASGLNTDNQHSTAYDSALVLREIERFDIYIKDASIWMDNLIHPSGRETELVNTNRLIRYYEYCTGGKTGFTDEAGYCLASSATKDGLNLIAVVLNCKDSQSRFSESIELFSHGFANYQNSHILSAEKCFDKTVKVVGGKENSICVRPLNDYFAIDKKGEKSTYETVLQVPNRVGAPIKKGQEVGVCLVLKNGVIIAEVPVISESNVAKQNFSDVMRKIVNGWAL